MYVLFDLAVLLGKTLKELSDISPLELRLWERYLSLNPCGETAMDYRFAQVVASLTGQSVEKSLLVKNRRSSPSTDDDILGQFEAMINGCIDNA